MNICAVIPTLNRRDSVIRAVESALDQTRPPDEIVVVDDGSVDGTSKALTRRFCSRIELVWQPNRGVGAARNCGVRLTNAPLIVFLDSDDIWHPQKLEHQCAGMNDPAIIFCATNWRRDGAARDAFSDLGLPTVAAELHIPMRRLMNPGGHALLTSTWMVRRSSFWKAGGFDESLRVAGDAALLFQLGCCGRFLVLPEVLAESSSIVDEWQLTNHRDPAYLKEATRNATMILLALQSEMDGFPDDVRLAYERLLTDHLRRDLEYLAMDGRAIVARQRARQLIARSMDTAGTLTALVALVCPSIIGLRGRIGLSLNAAAKRGPAKKRRSAAMIAVGS